MSTIAKFCSDLLANATIGAPTPNVYPDVETEEGAMEYLRFQPINIINSDLFPGVAPAYVALVAKGLARVIKTRGSRTWYTLA